MNIKFKPQRVRDPIHDLIEFHAAEFEHVLWRVIQTRSFQRLRRIKQLGFSEFVYPGATHSRFAHSVGVFHTARELMQVIERHAKRGDSFLESKAQTALAAALVHDLGHGPFSHAFEHVGSRLSLKMARHENVSDALIRSGEVAEAFHELGGGFANDVADLIGRNGPANMYGAVVSSQFDADRLDYVQRDRLMSGTRLAAIDFKWLIANLEVGTVSYGVDNQQVGSIDTFVLGPKAIHAAEAYVLGLFQLYPTVYLHKTTRGLEHMFEALLLRVISLILDGDVAKTALPPNHPLVQFAKAPDEVENVLRLDDAVIWGALSMMADAEDKQIADFARRMRDRKLFKCIDVRHRVGIELGITNVDTNRAEDVGEASGHDDARFERACEIVREKINDWSLSNPTETSRILVDQVERDPYKRFQESKGPLNQIHVRTSGGGLVDLGNKSAIVKAIRPFQAFRVYVAHEDDEAKALIEKLIQTGAKNDS